MIKQMKLYSYILLALSITLASCSKDIGNYEYKDINELVINGVNERYNVLRGIDTLRIVPALTSSLDEKDPSRYKYQWILRFSNSVVDTIATTRNLEFPVNVDPLTYSLFYRVLDLKTGVEWIANSTVTVGTPFSRGILLMGENEQGNAEAEMLSMVRDTIHVKNILSQSGLPPLQSPIAFQHTGGSSDTYIKLWALTKSGSYYLDRITMKATPANTLSKILYISDQINPQSLHPVAIAPQIRNAAGALSTNNYRIIVTEGGDLFTSYLVIAGGDFYNNPVNRVATAQQERLPAAPYLFYASSGTNSTAMNAVVWYDTKNQRFLNFSSFGFGTSSIVLTDAANSAFPWNQEQTGRKLIYGENTRNTDGNAVNGNSFAIMRDAANASFIYKFYVSTANPTKTAGYTVLPIATDFAKADLYAFSSNRSVVFYSVGNKLYAYDYNPNNERFYDLSASVGGDQITMLKFDTQIDPLANNLYIATYNGTKKGTLRRFLVGTNPNVVELTPAVDAEWSGLVKVKDFNWRAVN